MLTRRQYTALVFVTLFGSFAGGAVMEWVLTGKGARAEEAGKVVRADRFEAREFNVVDENGRVRAAIGLLGEGRLAYPHVSLLDEHGRKRAGIFLMGYPTLVLFDAEGRGDISLHGGLELDPRIMSGPRLTVSDKDGKERARLSVSADGSPSLSLSDKDGTTRAVLGCTELQDKRTESVEQRQESSLVLFKSDGDVLWKAP